MSGVPAHVMLEDGSLIERDVLGIIERIMEYDPALRVQFLDPERFPDLTEAPFRVIERCSDGKDYLVLSVWTLDETVMEKLQAADVRKNDILWNLEKKNQAVRDAQQRRFREEMDEALDIMEHVFKSPKGKYTFHNTDGELVTIDDSKKDMEG